MKVVAHSPKEKFLIFSRLPLTLAHLAEGLALANIKFVEFRSGVERKKQNLLVSVFETLDSWRVCLMELKYGARGLSVEFHDICMYCTLTSLIGILLALQESFSASLFGMPTWKVKQ